MKLKYQCYYGLEFQVFFNDFLSNDFNTLFKNLPLNRQYLAAAVPGTFYGRLVPKNSLHFVHSSFSLHWLSHAPKEFLDESSPAYNKGRIFYTGAPVAVLEAYLAQFAMDITSFLDARSLELVHGGLMTLILPCIPDGIPRSQADFLICNDLLEASLLDLTEEGLVSREKLDSFNLPMYNPTVQEFKALIENNPCFSIERMAPLVLDNEDFNVQTVVPISRAIWEGLISDHFGNGIIDELFDRYTQKVDSFIKSGSPIYDMFLVFVLLKRNE